MSNKIDFKRYVDKDDLMIKKSTLLIHRIAQDQGYIFMIMSLS